MGGPGVVLDILQLTLLLGPGGVAGWIVVRRLLPSVTGPERALAVALVAVATLLFSSHLVGAMGRFDLTSLTLVGLVLLAAVVVLLPQRQISSASVAPPARSPRWQLLLAVFGVAVVAGQWVTRVFDAYGLGITEYDSQHYHLPHAARFVQEASLLNLHHVSTDGVPNMFHPSDADVVHAVGMLVFGNDVASPLLNCLWAALGLLAAWCIGRRWNVAPLTLLGFTVVLGFPFTALSAGSALNDVPSYSLLLGALAFVLTADADPGGRTALAGLAGGVALSTKLTMLAPMGALTVGVLWLARRRKELWAAWLVPLTVAGSFWYLRNLLQTGSPLPSIDLPGLPYTTFPGVERYGFSVAGYLDEPTVVRDWFVPGLSAGVSVMWPLVGLVAVVTLAVALSRRSEPRVRMLAVVAAVTVAVYLVTPTTALGLRGRPTFFALNVRYAFPALVIALSLAPLVLRHRPRAVAVLAGALLVALLGGELGGRTPPPGLDRAIPAFVAGRFSAGVLAFLVVAGTGLWLLRRGAEGAQRSLLRPVVLVPGAVVALLVVIVLDDRYAGNRYAGDAIAVALDIAEPTAVAIADLDVQYPFYGASLDNRVQTIGEELDHGGIAPPRSCEVWRRHVIEGRYRYVVLPEADDADESPVAWTRGWAAARELGRDGGRVLYEINRGASNVSCAGDVGA